MIDLMPNLTFFLQLGIFLVTLVFMNYLIFKPILRLIAKRQAVTEGYRAEAERLQRETEGLVAQVEEKMKDARQEGLKVKGALTKEGEEEGKLLLGEVRREIEHELEKNRLALQAESKEAQRTLRKHSRELSQFMAEKILGRKVST